MLRRRKEEMSLPYRQLRSQLLQRLTPAEASDSFIDSAMKEAMLLNKEQRRAAEAAEETVRQLVEAQAGTVDDVLLDLHDRLPLGHAS